MAQYTQAGRLMAVTTPLAADALLLEKFSGSEAISGLFRFQLDLLADAATAVPFDQVLGQPFTVALTLPDGSVRYFNGIVSRFSQGPQVRSIRGDATFVRYRAEVAPRLWL